MAINTASRTLRLLFASIALLGAAPLQAQMMIEAYYMGELRRNASGGLETGQAYLEDAGLAISADVERFLGGGSVFAYLLWNNRSTFSDRYVGDLQVVSNIDAEQALRVYELWYEHRFSADVSLRVGLYDLNSEFDAIQTAGLFTNSSHGIGADYGQTGENGPSIFPATSLAARIEWSAGAWGRLRYAILDGVPGDPSDPSRTAIRLGGEDGLLHAVEYNRRLDGRWRLGLGGWLYTADFSRIGPGESGADPGRDNGNGGYYGFLDGPVFSSQAEGIDVNAFIRYGAADDRFNAIRRYLGAGAVVTGLVRTRPWDELGIAVARADIGGPYRDATASATDDHETVLELTYRMRLNDRLSVQPDVQYVVNPGGDVSLKNAWVFGLRFEFGLQREWN